MLCRLLAGLLRSLKALPAHVATLRTSSTQLRAFVRRDVKQLLHETAVRAVSNPVRDTVQRLRDLTGGPRRKQRGNNPLPTVEVAPGKLACTQEEAKQQWIKHFSAIENGNTCDPVEFIHSCYNRQASRDLSEYSITVADVPGLAELEWAMRAASTDRAYGLDCIPGEVVKFGAPQLSRVIYALLLKSVFRLTEPVQHKGGTLYCIWKGKGPKQTCDSYRGILVSSVLGKTLHKLVRSRCTPALASCTVPLQVGGLPRFPVTVPAQAARLFQSACGARQKPHALVFLDLQEAFYRIIRPLISGGTLSDEKVAQVCAAVHLPTGTMHDLRSFLGGESLISTAGSSPWASGAVEESLCDTWFRLPSEPELVKTQTGSRPRDSLSDMVFSFLFARVLKQVRSSLQAHGILAEIPYSREMEGNIHPLATTPCAVLPISDATWMDDLSMFVVGNDAATLVSDLAQGASTLIDACLQRALVPNLSRGKTEALVQFHGRGTHQARQTVFGEHAGSLPLTCRLWPSARLRIVSAYKHLGGYLQHNGGLRQELSFRTAQAWDAFNRRKKKVFKSPLVATADKAMLFQSLVSTVLFHGAGTWTDVEEGHLQKIDATLRQMACQMLAPEVPLSEAWHLGLTQVLARVGLPRATTQLHLARLRHLLACIQLQVPEIWALAHWEGSWLALVRASVHWLWEQVDGGVHTSNWQQAWEIWKEECRQSPGRWKARIRRALRKALLEERRQAYIEQHYGFLLKQLKSLGAVLPPDIVSEGHDTEVCALCGSTFQSFQSWAVHAFKKHGRVREARRLAAGSQCPVCLRHYASHVRLCRHLHHSTPCRNFRTAHKDWIPPQPGQGSKKAPKEYLLCAPALQALGPVPAQICTEVDHELERPSAEVLDCLSLLEFDDLDLHKEPDETWERIRASFSCVCLPLKRLRLTAEVWKDRVLCQTTQGHTGPNTWFLLRAAEWTLCADFAEWLAPNPRCRATPPHTFRQGLTSLAVLEVQWISIPCLLPWTVDHVVVCVGAPPAGSPAASLQDSAVIYTHEESLRQLAEGKDLDFLSEEPVQCGFCLTLIGLPMPSAPPVKCSSSPGDSLRALQLACDILRLALRLWSGGVHACLLLPTPLGG